MSLRSWYRTSINVPYAFDHRALTFAANSVGLVSNILGLAANGISVVFSDRADSAFADPENKRIVLPKAMFSECKESRMNGDATVEETISCSMGVVIHEAMHFKVSPPEMGTSLEAFDVDVNETSAAILNVLEDVYIEKLAMDEYEHMAWTISEAWKYFLAEDKGNLPWQPETAKEVVEAIRFMIAAKYRTRTRDYYTVAEKQLLKWIESVETMSDQGDRIRLAKTVYDWVTEKLPPQEKEQIEGNAVQPDARMTSFGDDEDGGKFIVPCDTSGEETSDENLIIVSVAMTAEAMHEDGDMLVFYYTPQTPSYLLSTAIS